MGDTQSKSGPEKPRCTSIVEQLRIPHFSLAWDDHCRLVVVRRTPAPFEDLADLDEAYADLDTRLARIQRPLYCLLIDTRRGPVRNDSAFETAFARHRRGLELGFAKCCILASTASGRLQIKRHAKDDGVDVFVSDDPAQAFAYFDITNHEFALVEPSSTSADSRWHNLVRGATTREVAGAAVDPKLSVPPSARRS